MSRKHPEAPYGAMEFRNILIASLQKLSPALRVVFVLRDIEDHSMLETSEVLNVSANAVTSRLSRARRELREELSRYFKGRSNAPWQSAVPVSSRI